MKKLLATSAITLALALAGGAANATTFNLDVSGGGATIGVATYTPSHSFSDVYTFTIASLSDLSATINASFVTSTNGGVQTFVLKNTTTGSTIGSTLLSSQLNGKTYTTYVIDASSLTTGSYELLVTGKGPYSGLLTLTSSVPEASTTAMMLGGLAFVGMMALRRRRNEKNESALPTGMAAA